MDAKKLTTLIRKRRAVFPNMYQERSIEKDILLEILENANWAPTHRHTEPWRFKVYQGESLKTLSEYLGDAYKNNTPPDKYLERKFKKTRKKPLQSACVIAICMKRDEEERIPEEEEIASVAMAVQNMWLTCTAHGIGAYWSSPKYIYQAGEELGLEKGERCLGLFYMGYADGSQLVGKRGNIHEKVRWM